MDEQFSRGATGDLLSTANSSATTVTFGANNSQIFDAGRLMVSLGITNASLAEFLFPAATSAVFRLEEFEFQLPGAGSTYRPLVVRAGTANAAHLGVDNANHLQLRDRTGTPLVGGTSAAALTQGTRYDVEVALTVGTAGSLALRIYAAGSTTPIETIGPLTADTGTVQVDRFRVGTSAIASQPVTYWVGAAEMVPGAAWLGPATFGVTASLASPVEGGGDLVVLATRTGTAATLSAVSSPVVAFTASGNTLTGTPPLSLADVAYRVRAVVTDAAGRTRGQTQAATVRGCEESMLVGGVQVPTVVYFGFGAGPTVPPPLDPEGGFGTAFGSAFGA